MKLSALRTGLLHQPSDQFVSPAVSSVLVPEPTATRPELWQVQTTVTVTSLHASGYWSLLDSTLDVAHFYDPSPAAPLAELPNFFRSRHARPASRDRPMPSG